MKTEEKKILQKSWNLKKKDLANKMMKPEELRL